VKRSRAAWLTVAVLLLLVVLLVLFLPARWVVPFVQTRLHGLRLDGVHGLVWDGAAERVGGPDGRPLGRVQWQLSRRALWGALDLRLDFQGPRLAASGHLQRDAQGRPAWREVKVRTGLADWSIPSDPALGTPQGTLSVALAHAVLQAGWPVELEGRAQWHGAAMQTRAGRIALGNLETDLHGSNGVLSGQLHDLGEGPLRVAGQWQASPLGWRLDLLLQPRSGNPALRRWLARLGTPETDGTVHLQRRGGLAAAAPEAAR